MHPVSFSILTHLDRLSIELARWEDRGGMGIVMLDPAYKYMAGSKSSQLFDMGAVLTPLQIACYDAKAALLVGHHYNRREGASRLERFSGAGLLEWARFIISLDSKKIDPNNVVTTFEITGNSVEDNMIRVQRTMRALDETANPELSYEIQVLGEGEEAREAKFMKTGDRLMRLLPAADADPASVRRLHMQIVVDGGQHLQESTMRSALNKLAGDGLAKNHATSGNEGRWSKTV